MHYISNIDDTHQCSFVDRSCMAFFDRINSFYNQKNFYDLFFRFTEGSLCHLYSQGIIKHFDLNQYNYFSELGVSRSEEKWGRIDLVIEDYQNKLLYVIETKSFWSNETEPKSNYWSKETTDKFYRENINQAKSYISYEKFFTSYDIHLISLVFSRIEFTKMENLDLWNFKDVEVNEFFGFETYNTPQKQVGIAIYGLIEKWNN